MATPYMYGPAGGRYSPFIPPANLSAGGSPYVSPYGSPYRTSTALPNSSPNAGPAPLPGAPNTPINPYPYSPYGPGWQRPRRPSYSGPRPDEFVPSWMNSPQNYQRSRRRSFNASSTPGWPYPPSPNYYWPTQPVYPQGYAPDPGPGFNLHPLLNGDSPHTLLLFDLSAPKFSAMKYVGPGQTDWLSEAELGDTASWPELNHLRIECDLVPQWPIVFELDAKFFGGQLPPPGTHIPPITVGDVLVKIFDHFAQRITHIDWARLNHEDEVAIAKAYTKRCKGLGSAEAIEKSQGVKRIDYTLGKVWFRGLTRAGDGMDVLKLHLAKRGPEEGVRFDI